MRIGGTALYHPVALLSMAYKGVTRVDTSMDSSPSPDGSTSSRSLLLIRFLFAAKGQRWQVAG